MKVSDEKRAATEAGATPAAPSWPATVCVCLALALGTLCLYWPVGRHDFVNYDDSDYVTANTHVQGGLTWENIAWAFTTGHASNWHPLTWLSHMLDCQCFGQNAGLQHLVSVGFHALNAVLVFLVLRGLTGAFWRSACVAAFFAWHPLHVESVAWISERKDVLSACFALLTLGAYGKFVTGAGKPAETEVDRTQVPAEAWYVLSLLAFVLGLMSKPMLVTLPFVLLLLDYWPLRRWEFASTRQRLRIVVEKLPFLALSLASCIVTFIVQRQGGAVSTVLSLGARLANAFVSCARYLAKTFWPEKLSVLYPHPGHWPGWQVAGAVALVLAVSVAVVALGRRRPYLPVGWLWFLGMLVPVIGLVQVGIQSMADRYTYLPLLGVFIMVVWGIDDALPPVRGRAVALGSGAGLALAACAWLTARQIPYWADSMALFQHAVEATRDNYLAYNNLGFYLSNQGRSEEAMKYYEKSLEINPNYEDALNNLGYALAGQKRYPEAIAKYEAALRIRPNHVEVHNNLGNALSEMGRIPEAIEHYRFVLAHKPDHADAHNNLGIALAMQGHLDEAIDHFHAALRYKPNYASAHSNLGNALAAQHQFVAATKEYEESLRLNPDDAQAHNNLANVFAEQGRLADAVRNYREALRLNAKNPEAHFNLGLALARLGKLQEAKSHYVEALRLKPDYQAAQEQLKQISGP